MRYSIKTLGAATALAVGCVTALGSGVAHADPVGADSIYAPSALVLTVGKGSDTATAGIQRAVVLSCTPKSGGSHPAAERACTEIRSVHGQFEQLVAPGESGLMCTKIWDPVLVTADGVWEGKRVSWQHTFANSCTMNETGRSTFAF